MSTVCGTRSTFAGGTLDGSVLTIADGERYEHPVVSAAGIPATEIYVRRRVGGQAAESVFDFMLRRRTVAA